MKLRSVEWPTLLLLVATYLVWGAGTLFWQASGVASVVLAGIAIAQHSSLQHEALHGHPFRKAWLNEVLVFPALSILVPYRRFRTLHLQHHQDPALTDPYDDPESHYMDPAEWARTPRVTRVILRANNTLAGRILLGPLVGTVQFLGAEARALMRGDGAVWLAWVMNAAGVLLVLFWLDRVALMPVWAYLVAVYLGIALLKIRTFLEHRAHEAFRARTVVVEDRGPLALLFLNNNFHVVHHMHPQVPWYELPALYASRRDHFLRRNEGYVFASYAQVFRRYLWRSKDPVPHPVWPVRKPQPDQP